MIIDSVLIFTAGVFGFLLGRFSVHRIDEGEEAEREEMLREQASAKRERKLHGGPERGALGSPVAGCVIGSEEGDGVAVTIRPESGKLYAPAAGKITRLYPMGNEFRFSTEFGVEMHITVGNGKDDLLDHYYRPRVVQNEVVPKGRLLLEFDVNGLEAEGESADILLQVQQPEWNGDVELVGEGSVKVGEPVVRIY